LQKIFYSLNKTKIESLTSAFTNLPIDRCHHGRISLTVYVDSADALTGVRIVHGTENPKTDSLILKEAVSHPGGWKAPEQDGRKINFGANLQFILLNNTTATRYSRSQTTSGNLETITYRANKNYDSRKNCEDADFYYDAGIEEFKKSDYRGAIKSFKKTLQINPYDLDANYNLAVSYLKLGKKKEACECLARASTLGDAASETARLKNCLSEPLK
jgi:tetratricopeptide (TPR) repeat protein